MTEQDAGGFGAGFPLDPRGGCVPKLVRMEAVGFPPSVDLVRARQFHRCGESPVAGGTHRPGVARHPVLFPRLPLGGPCAVGPLAVAAGKWGLSPGGTLGPHSVILPAADIGPEATVGPASLVMRGETVPAGSRWCGNPIGPWREVVVREYRARVGG